VPNLMAYPFIVVAHMPRFAVAAAVGPQPAGMLSGVKEVAQMSSGVALKAVSPFAVARPRLRSVRGHSVAYGAVQLVSVGIWIGHSCSMLRMSVPFSSLFDPRGKRKPKGSKFQ
jgi:hypothetical protein